MLFHDTQKNLSGVCKNIYGFFLNRKKTRQNLHVFSFFYSIFSPIEVLFISVVATIVADSNTLLYAQKTELNGGELYERLFFFGDIIQKYTMKSKNIHEKCYPYKEVFFLRRLIL